MRVVRKTCAAGLCGYLILAAVSAALGGQVLVLKGPNLAPYKEAFNGFRQLYPGGIEMDHGKTHEFLSRVHSDPPSLIVAIGRASAAMAHERASAIPLIFLMVPNPAESGLSGGNVAGVAMNVPGDVQLAHFKELLINPKKPVAVVYNPASSAALVAQAQNAASALNLVLQQIPVDSPDQVRSRVEMVKPVIGAIWVVPDESFVTRDNKWFNFLLEESASLRLPLFFTMNSGSTFVQQGALAAVVSDFAGMGRQCAELVKQVEAGKTKFENVGIRPPAALDWEVNLATAEKLDLKLPPEVLKSAKTYH